MLMKQTSQKFVQTRKKTIDDFGDQWEEFQSSDGLYGSPEFLQDLFGSLIPVSAVKGKKVLEIGSGTGRITEMLVKKGAKRVFAVEPAFKAFKVLKKNLSSYQNVEFINCTGEDFEIPCEVDFAISIGVIHHIICPQNTLVRMHEALASNGTLIIWVYGWEGNQLYLILASMLRMITRRMSHRKLLTLSKLLAYPLKFYGSLCYALPLPMRKYFLNVINKWNEQTRVLTIYDQLNPEYAKYYKRQQILDEVKKAGFKSAQIEHRHGYSWTVVAKKT